MDEDEFTERCSRMANFQCEALGEDEGAYSTTGFLWAVWASRAFPEWWAEWQSALPHIEAIMEDEPGFMATMTREVQAGLIDPPKQEEISTWQSSTGRN